MMTLLALLFSGAALCFLAHIDEKRRRVYGLEASRWLPYRRLMWCLVFAPVFALLWVANWAALVMWMMAVFPIGWWFAWRKPVNKENCS